MRTRSARHWRIHQRVVYFRGMDKIQKIVECLKRYEPEKVIVFGSFARGEADEQSDVDLVVIKQTDKRFLERLLEVAKLLDNDLGKVDVFVYTREEFEEMRRRQNPFIAKVITEGRTIYPVQ
jgi:predicted nucleotidyltransferase